jgi:hypothetical protein
MKKRLVLALAALSLVGVVGGGLSLASASPSDNDTWGQWFARRAVTPTTGSEAPRITTAQSIVVISRGGHAQFIDLPPTDDSQGDRVVGHTPLFNRDGDHVGEINFEEVITKLSGDGEEQAVITVRLFGRGQITAQGDDTNASIITLAVTGGTENFQNVRGEVELRFRANNVVVLVFQLIP